MATLIDGRVVSATVRERIRKETKEWTSEGNRAPFLSVILVGDDPASASYVRAKAKAAETAGIEAETIRHTADLPEAELLKIIDRLNWDNKVDGILVQLPLPDHIDESKVIESIASRKDVDGFHPVSVGKLSLDQPCFMPATPSGIIEMLKHYNIPTEGQHAVVIGRSNIVGKPMAQLFLRKGVDATVTVCHSRTKNLKELTRLGDIVVSAVGWPNTVTADMIKEGAVVIDVGINRVDDATRERGYRLVGDVDFEGVSEKASFITPVPGGVGPMTIAMLLKNTLRAAKRNEAKKK